LATSLISLIVEGKEGNWGVFGYNYSSSSRTGRGILFVPSTSIPVYRSGRGIGYRREGSNSSIGILKITGSRYLFFIRVIKPDRIGPLIRSGLATNRSLLVQIYYISSLIIESRIVIIVRVPVFCYIYIPLYRRILYRYSISGSSSLLKSP
jgi:hypothetical protein